MVDRKILLIGSAATIAVLLAGTVIVTQSRGGDAYAQCTKSAVAGGMDSFGTDFTLTRDDGVRVTAADVFTKPTLLYFGYTFCPDVCPLDSARNAEAETLLQEQGKDVQTVFITVDPARDTPEVLSDFTSLFSDDMIGLTGSEDEIAAVNKGWRNYFKLQNEDEPEYYLVDHMTNTYLVMPGNKTVEFYNRDTTPEVMSESVGCFMDAAA
ncbi:SCO family protein [Paracoccus sp. JM45]|uniref:SCO family protein n=1 Tax=Paracoccus sp. JM45 TaxID=2283626 RepID=UPI000E6CFFFB|nr:SCO family protein [Paracoccus sp. JM45]RJE80989.1 SCO family protein [Paracoccus sp. JM45]